MGFSASHLAVLAGIAISLPTRC